MRSAYGYGLAVERVEVVGLANADAVVEAAKVWATPRFVHVSSLAAREPALSDYGWSKHEAEGVVAGSGLPWTIVRPPAVYGPGDRETLAYFEKRPPQAARDADFALDYVKRNAHTPEQQQQVLAALEFKCSVLWAMCDALQHAYVDPKDIPPGAFVPEA